MLFSSAAEVLIIEPTDFATPKAAKAAMKRLGKFDLSSLFLIVHRNNSERSRPSCVVCCITSDLGHIRNIRAVYTTIEGEDVEVAEAHMKARMEADKAEKNKRKRARVKAKKAAAKQAKVSSSPSPPPAARKPTPTPTPSSPPPASVRKPTTVAAGVGLGTDASQLVRGRGTAAQDEAAALVAEDALVRAQMAMQAEPSPTAILCADLRRYKDAVYAHEEECDEPGSPGAPPAYVSLSPQSSVEPLSCLISCVSLSLSLSFEVASTKRIALQKSEAQALGSGHRRCVTTPSSASRQSTAGRSDVRR